MADWDALSHSSFHRAGPGALIWGILALGLLSRAMRMPPMVLTLTSRVFRRGDIHLRVKLTLAKPPPELLGHSGSSMDKRRPQAWRPCYPGPRRSLSAQEGASLAQAIVPWPGSFHTVTPR